MFSSINLILPLRPDSIFVFGYCIFSSKFSFASFLIFHFSLEKLFLPICLKVLIFLLGAVIMAVSKVCMIIPISVSPGVGIS